MNELKTLAGKLAGIKIETAEIERQLRNATQRRDSLLAEIQAIDAGIEAAEIADAAAQAAVILGEPDNTRETAEALKVAREAAFRKPELIQQRRIADAVIDGLARRHEEAHSRYVALTEQHRRAQIEFVEVRADRAMASARDAIGHVANAVAEAAAIRRVLESLGGRWSFGSIDINQYSPIFNPAHDAVELMAAGLMNEIKGA